MAETTTQDKQSTANMDLWRDGDFVRPKWGIYRSLKDKGNLRPNEETVRFANFSIPLLPDAEQ